MDVLQFQKLIKQSCQRETSNDPNGWSDSNPTWGHCAVVSLLAQDYFGGQILRASLGNTPFATSSSHYRNDIYDFTAEQFGNTVLNLIFEPRSREYLLSNQNTATRYILLKSMFESLIDD